MPEIPALNVIATPRAPAAIGPYSQAIAAGGWVFTAGQIALDPASGELLFPDDIRGQTEQVLRNLQAVLEASGSVLGRVVKTTVYLADLQDFAAMNEIYGRFFTAPCPARSTIEASRLLRGAKVEIEAIAIRSER